MASTDGETARAMFLRRLDELYLAAEKAQTYGECSRLRVLLFEARMAYWKRSEKDFEDRDFMWGDESMRVQHLITDRIKPLDPPMKIEIDKTPPRISAFFDQDDHISGPPDSEMQKRYMRQIDEAEKLLDVSIEGLLRELFSYCNGGYTNFILQPSIPWARTDYRDTASGDDGGQDVDVFNAEWDWIFDNRVIASVQHWRTIDSFIAAEIESREKDEDYDWNLDPNWRDNLAGLDKLVILCMEENKRTWDLNMTCLDYRHGPRPGLVILNADKTGDYFEIEKSWTCFETLFHRLRRWPLREFDGVLRKRGDTIVQILDEGRWR